jgi:hypothetical protein
MDIEEQQIGEEVHYPKQIQLNANFMLSVRKSKIAIRNNVEFLKVTVGETYKCRGVG